MADPADPERKTTAPAGRLPRRRTGAPREHPQEETRGPLAKMRLPRREAKRRGADAEAEVERDIERLLGDFDARLEAVQRRLDRVLDRRA